jgi:chromate transporter
MTAELARGPLREVIVLFLRLGLTAFGGPAAHVALMEEEVVRRRHWLTRQEFLDLFGLASVLPGPTSTELAIYIGYRRGGWRGLVAAGVCFIAPAMLLVMALAWAYQRWGALPRAAGLLYGVKPVLIAVIGQALWSLGRGAAKTRSLAALAAAAAALSLAGAPALAILFGAAAMVTLSRAARAEQRAPRGVWLGLAGVAAVLVLLPVGLSWVTAGAAAPGLGPLFAVFLKLGAVVYGSGYVLLAFMQADLVQRLGWLTAGQLLDAVAVGQITPGPVFTTATFIGYLLGGVPGALVATAAIFLPSFVLVAVSGPWLARLRTTRPVADALDGLNAAALGLMAAVTWQLARAAVTDPLTAVLAVVSLAAVLRWRVNSLWLLLAGAGLGLLAAPR